MQLKFLTGVAVAIALASTDYRGGSNGFGGILFGFSNLSNFHVFWVSPPAGTAGVTAKKNGK